MARTIRLTAVDLLAKAAGFSADGTLARRKQLWQFASLPVPAMRAAAFRFGRSQFFRICKVINPMGG